MPPAPPAAPVVAVVEPRLRNADELIRAKDYPREAMRAGAEGAVRFQVAVSRRGRPLDCRILEGSGNALLDAATCRQVLGRASFAPARDRNGKAIVGTYTRRMVWRLAQR